MAPTEGFNIVIFLVLGLLIAAALQLMITSLGIALGLGLWGWSAHQNQAADGQAADAQSRSGASLPVTPLVGVGLVCSSSLVLFAAALLATEFSQISDPRQGAVFGVLLWAAYWVLLVWFGSTRLFGLANTALGGAMAGSRQLMATVRQLWRSQPSDPSATEQDILQNLVSEVSQLADLQRQLPMLLNQQRDTLIAEITERTDLTSDEAEAVVAGLEPEASISTANASPSAASRLQHQFDLPSWQQLVRQLLNQVDLSEIDLETLWQQLQSIGNGDAHDEAASRENNVILDAEDFVCHAPAWLLRPEAIEQEFYERIYDPQAATELVKAQLSKLDRDDFLEWLQQRQDLAADQLEPIADRLRQVQQSVLDRVSSPSQTVGQDRPSPDRHNYAAALQAMEDRLLAYCRYTNLDVLTAEGVTEKVEVLRQEFELPTDMPLASQPEVETLTDVLARRQGLSEPQQQTLTRALVSALGNKLSRREDGKTWMEQAHQHLADYFHAIDWSAVSLEEIKPEVMSQLRSLDLQGTPDWQSLGAHLQVPDEVKGDLLAWLQSTGQTLSRQPRRWAERIGESAQSFAQYLVRQITHYLKFQDISAFRPDQIAEDLTTILKNAVELLPNPADWQVLSDLKQLIDPALMQETLESRRDMTADQIQEILGWFETAWHTVTQQVLNWTQTLWAETRDLFATGFDNLDGARQRLVEGIADAQQNLQNRAAQVRAELKAQADALRRQVAIAAAWLFLSLLFSAGVAMAAGWWAVKY